MSAELKMSGDEAYDLIDRFLRNNLDDTDYAMFSDALELLRADAPEAGQEAAAVQAAWQDIATAPRDGTEILLGRPANEELEQDAISVPGCWQKGYEDGVDYMGVDDGFVDSHQVFSGGRSFGAESYRYAPNQPTHWMPLPAPPAALCPRVGGEDTP